MSSLNKDDLLSLQRYALYSRADLTNKIDDLNQTLNLITVPREAKEIETEISWAKADIEKIDEIIAKLNYLFWEIVEKEKEEKRMEQQQKYGTELPF